MDAIFINLSNHDSSKWSVKQIEEALKLSENGPIIDIPFPNIDPELTSDEITKLSCKYYYLCQKQKRFNCRYIKIINWKQYRHK